MKGIVELAHGSGGRHSHELITELFMRYFNNPWLQAGNDAAVCPLPGQSLVVSTDGHVVSPLFFAGGDIGSLSIHGTINDLAMMGATPLYLTVGFILEAGFALDDLEKIVSSMAKAAKLAGVSIVTGDTKVVEKGHGDGIFITTTGIGSLASDIDLSGSYAKPGDAILVNGTMGDHGVTIMSTRENLGFETDIQSDSAALHELVREMLSAVPDIHCLRDPTRGGLATTLNELANQSGVGMEIKEDCIPVRPEVSSACELLGLDPLYVANEGKLIAICPGEKAEMLLTAMQTHPLGKNASIIGYVTEDPEHLVQLETPFGGYRLVDWLTGDQLPRIC